MNAAIETENLTKHYGDVKAVESLSIKVREGEIYAFLGLNGAGKTTTIRMLLGMIKPTGGYARVLNTLVQPGRTHPWESVGYLVEIPRHYPELSVVESLEVARRLRPGTPKKAVDEVIERLSLSEYANRLAGNLSQGNAQRLGLAKALLHRPSLLLLDEPASGLDPAGIVEIRDLLLELTREHGVTVFVSSHILAEVARIARRIGIIHQGRLLQELSIEELERNRRRRLLLRVRDVEAARQVFAAAGRAVEFQPDGALALHDAAACERPDEVNLLMVRAGVSPTFLAVEEEGLEQYFLRLVGMNGAKPA